MTNQNDLILILCILAYFCLLWNHFSTNRNNYFVWLIKNSNFYF